MEVQSELNLHSTRNQLNNVKNVWKSKTMRRSHLHDDREGAMREARPRFRFWLGGQCLIWRRKANIRLRTEREREREVKSAERPPRTIGATSLRHLPPDQACSLRVPLCALHIGFLFRCCHGSLLLKPTEGEEAALRQ